LAGVDVDVFVIEKLFFQSYVLYQQYF